MGAPADFSATVTYGTAPQYPIESVDNALRLILLFGDQPALRLTDVSRYLGVASSTAHRLLAALQYRGFVRRDGATYYYVAGPTLDGLAFSLLRMDIRSLTRPVLEQLNAELGETIHLGQLERADVRFIDSIESTRALRVASRLGRSMPAHCSSTGKALLAGLTDPVVVQLYPEERLNQLTPQSIGTRTQLLAALEEVRDLGYATCEEESEEGVSSVAVALRTTLSRQLAVNASVPASRMSVAIRKEIVERVRWAAGQLNRLPL